MSADSHILELINEARGDEPARDRLLSEFHTYLLLIAEREVGGGVRRQFAASDAVQETMIRADAAFREFRGTTRDELGAWLRRILINRVRQAHRDLHREKRDIARERSINAESGVASSARSPADPHATPKTAALTAERSEEVKAALERLSQDHRTVLQLRNWAELPFAEIAVKMDRSEQAVQKLWLRALLAMESELRVEK